MLASGSPRKTGETPVPWEIRILRLLKESFHHCHVANGSRLAHFCQKGGVWSLKHQLNKPWLTSESLTFRLLIVVSTKTQRVKVLRASQKKAKKLQRDWKVQASLVVQRGSSMQQPQAKARGSSQARQVLFPGSFHTRRDPLIVRRAVRTRNWVIRILT